MTTDTPTTELVPHGLARLQRHPVIDTIDEKTLALIASQIAPGCNRGEIGHFLELCAHYDLDPFAKEAWCAKGKGDNARLLIMVGRDGLRKIAKRNGLEIDGDVVRANDVFKVKRKADRTREITHEYEEGAGEGSGNETKRGPILGAWAEAYERDGGTQRGYFFAQLREYKPTNASKLQYSPWGSQESVMIQAAAERQATRQATPLGGLLAEGEDARVFDATVVEDATPVQELTDTEVDELVAAATAVWDENQALMQLVAAGATDAADVRSAVCSLTRDQALAVIAAVTSETDPTEAEGGEQP
jgi:hypothetical protein